MIASETPKGCLKDVGRIKRSAAPANRILLRVNVHRGKRRNIVVALLGPAY
jgi:hypothetical protein